MKPTVQRTRQIPGARFLQKNLAALGSTIVMVGISCGDDDDRKSPLSGACSSLCEMGSEVAVQCDGEPEGSIDIDDCKAKCVAMADDPTEPCPEEVVAYYVCIDDALLHTGCDYSIVTAACANESQGLQTCEEAHSCAPGCLPDMPNNNFCDSECLNEACDWDQGDCSR